MALQAAKLCKYCQVIRFNDSDPRFKDPDDGTLSSLTITLDYLIHDSLPDLPVLDKSAKGGCDFCLLLRDTILTEDSAADDIHRQFLAEKQKCDVELRLQYCRSPPQDCHSKGSAATRITKLTAILDTDYRDIDQSGKRTCIDFSFLIEGCPGHDTVARWLQLHDSTSCVDRFHHGVISWAKLQIEMCASEHAHSKSDLEFCPARLLDICSEPIRLVDYHEIQKEARNMEPPSVRYTALSYCWGNKDQSQQQLLTNRENLPDRITGITEQHLTPVLRDAVLATRLLSIRYLWVDSLCILQGDRQDWEHQSAKMDEIYRNAYVTIATPVSGSCGQGFRYTTRKKIYVPFRSQLNVDARGLFSLRYSGCNTGSTINYGEVYYADVDLSRWASRGWTFQEDIMSTRLLLFGPAEIFFRCGGTVSYICGHREENYLFNFHERLDRLDWYQILGDYSTRQQGLSRSTDILPALSGIATAFSRQMRYLNDDYVAGLWKDNLFAGLAWMIADSRPFKRRSLPELVKCLESPAIYLSPSWAWPGKGRVESIHNYCANRPLLSRCTTQASVTVKGDNPFGEVEDGMVQITGKVAELNSDLVLSKESSTTRSLRPWILKSKDGHPWLFHLDWDPLGDSVLQGELKMVLTGTGFDRRHGRAYFGILIQESKTSPEVRYYRVGTFMSHPKDRHPRNSAEQFFDRHPIQTVDII